jgi:HTH-type transcriptional regulator/antitoxin HigA
MEGKDMKVRAKRLEENLPKTFKGLFDLHPIRIIRDEVDYENAVNMVNRLAGLDPITEDQEEYLVLLSNRIEEYDKEHYAIDTSGLTPLDTLEFLLEQNGMSGSDLGRLLGHRQLGNAILRGERRLSINHIRILSKHFGVSADVFLEA